MARGSTVAVATEGADGAPRGTIADWVLGAIGGAMIAGAVVVLIMSGSAPRDTGVVAAPPALELLEPADGATVTAPIELRFTAEESRLSWTPAGWGTDGLHVHAEINGIEVMPAQGDIVPETGNRYVWTVPNAAPGEVTVRLVWSDSRHRAVDGGASSAVRLTVASAGEGADQ